MYYGGSDPSLTKQAQHIKTRGNGTVSWYVLLEITSSLRISYCTIYVIFWPFEFFNKLCTTMLGMSWAIRLRVFATALLSFDVRTFCSERERSSAYLNRNPYYPFYIVGR